MKNYTNVTEIPGQRATNDQLSTMMTRYHLAKKYAKNKDVLEIACGSGTGLGYIGEVATSVVGGDIDESLVNIATANYSGDNKIHIQQLDAQHLPFADNSFDLVILFEALYYIPDVAQFISESRRVLRPNGKIIIATVNNEWHGFNPSPFSKKYYTAEELLAMYNQEFQSKLYLGFEDLPKGSNFLISFVRRSAVALGLIPKTMKGKELLKRFFYGKLTPIPNVIYDGLGKVEKLIPFDPNNELHKKNYKQLYLIVDTEK
ncbi:MAG: class I SAM-dependent methyltransferase [Bacteroidota bacterium]